MDHAWFKEVLLAEFVAVPSSKIRNFEDIDDPSHAPVVDKLLDFHLEEQGKGEDEKIESENVERCLRPPFDRHIVSTHLYWASSHAIAPIS